MLRPTETVPAEFAGYPESFDWYEIVHNEQVVAVLGLDWVTVPHSVVLHVEFRVRVWNRRIVQTCTEGLEWLKTEAKSRGCMAIVGQAIDNPDTDKFFKFADMFGFGGHMRLAITRLMI